MPASPSLLPYYEKNKIEAGCDEAGRGCLAGPVYAAAVILPEDFFHPLLNDSKQLKEKERDILREIIEKEAVAWSVAAVDAQEIDKINILKASIRGMHLALDSLSVLPQYILVDGNRFTKYQNIPHQCFVKGDGRFASIAAASVLAKTHRDEYMRKIAAEFPEYGWERNMAYPTKKHREAIKMYGPCKYHRMSYKLLEDPILF
jgi:ribonuclease HII